jgi:hypothetical protein
VTNIIKKDGGNRNKQEEDESLTEKSGKTVEINITFAFKRKRISFGI